MQIFPKFLQHSLDSQILVFIPSMVWKDHKLGKVAQFEHGK